MTKALDKGIFGDRLQLARKHRNLTQQELGEKIGRSHPMVFQLENNFVSSKTQLAYLPKLVEVLGVSEDYLLGIDAEMTPADEWSHFMNSGMPQFMRADPKFIANMQISIENSKV